MRIEPFVMERMQSTWENQVEFNLSESGVHPLRLEELLDDEGGLQALLRQPLVYTQSNGTPELRDRIAALYPGATRDSIEVTNGGSEANYVSLWKLVEPGDDVVMMVPNYMQAWGLARGFGGNVRPWALREDRAGQPRWRPDLGELRTLVSERTRIILLCNPNNPTGGRLTASELDEVCRIAGRHGTWVLSDEIYRGAELDDRDTPTVWGRYERAIVTSGLSKAYGLPGLRTGWLVSQPALVESLWSYHDYTTIAPGALNDRLATLALQPSRRGRILARTRSILRANFPILAEWLASHADLFSYTAPEAGAIAYIRYHKPVNSTRLVTELRDRKSVLVVPGDHFGMDGYLRIGYGAEPPQLREGLNRLHDLLTSLGA